MDLICTTLNFEFQELHKTIGNLSVMLVGFCLVYDDRSDGSF